jgi:hypothetical protein
MIRIIDELLGRDPLTKRMKALFQIERCRRSLSSILSMGIIDESFDERRKVLEEKLDDFCMELRDKITYSDWWGDWDAAKRPSRLADLAGMLSLQQMPSSAVILRLDHTAVRVQHVRLQRRALDPRGRA